MVKMKKATLRDIIEVFQDRDIERLKKENEELRKEIERIQTLLNKVKP